MMMFGCTGSSANREEAVANSEKILNLVFAQKKAIKPWESYRWNRKG